MLHFLVALAVIVPIASMSSLANAASASSEPGAKQQQNCERQQRNWRPGTRSEARRNTRKMMNMTKSPEERRQWRCRSS